MKKRLFVKNAAIMTVTALILRSIGILFRIYISNRVGAEGMGLYQLIISVYVLASSFAAAGLNTAVTRLCTDELACGRPHIAKRILYVGVTLGVLVGVFSAVILFYGAHWIADVWIKDARAIPSLRMLTVSLPFMGASSCIKGYFLAKRKVTCSSVAQILEQLVRIAAIWIILEIGNVSDVEGACFAILLGDTIAEAASCLYMIGAYITEKRPPCDTRSDTVSPPILRSLFSIAAPITGGRYVNSGLRTVENLAVPTALTAFCGSREVALAQFGTLKGMVMPLLFFPSSFLNAVSALLIPEISEAKALGNQKQLTRTVNMAMQITLQSSLLIAGLFFVLAYPLGNAIYHDNEVGWMLRILAPLAPVMYLESVVVGMLKGLNQQTHSLIYSVIDSLSRILLIPALLPTRGINGFFVIMIISNLLTCSLNTTRLFRVCGTKPLISKWFLRPLLAVIAAAIIIGTVNSIPFVHTADNVAYCVLFGGLFCAAYLLFLWIFGGISRDDLTLIRPIRSQNAEKIPIVGN